MSKWMKTALVVALVAAAGCIYWKAQRSNTQTAKSKQSTLAKVEYRSIKQEVTCEGPIEANLEVEIKCKASGQIVELPFDISDSVKKGDLLLRVDPVDEERTVRQTTVKLEAAQAKLARAKQSLLVSQRNLEKTRKETAATLKGAQASSKDLRAKAERTASLLQKKYASPEESNSAEAEAVQGETALQKAYAGLDGVKVQEEELELSRQDIKTAQADVDSIQVDLENAQQRLTETKVYAPMAGIVSDKLVQVGQIISSPTMNVSGGTALMTLSDLSRVFVLASVDETDIGMVVPKQKATITVDGFPDDVFTGEVVRVATKGAKNSNVVTFDVKIEILGEAKSKLRPLMTADVKILIAAKENVLSVPSETVKRRGVEKIVETPNPQPGGDPIPVTIKTGIDDGTNTEILSGVQEGTEVVVPQEDTTKSSKDSGGPFGGPPPGGGGGPPP